MEIGKMINSLTLDESDLKQMIAKIFNTSKGNVYFCIREEANYLGDISRKVEANITIDVNEDNVEQINRVFFNYIMNE